jgi:urea transport system substrate-binding protein
MVHCPQPARAAGLLLVAILALLALAGGCGPEPGGEPVRVGVLHSLTGTMAISEVAVQQATLLAIEEVNASGGVLGRRIEPVVVDGASDWPTFAKGAEDLVTRHGVSVIFGCWTSASRKTVKPVIEEHDSLLFYPVQYEGVEQSPNIVYTGAAPNQQIIPAVVWAYETLGKRRFYLVGSDYVFPRVANAIIRDYLTALGAEVVGERYIPIGGDDVAGIVGEIAAERPGVILNTINGDSNVAFFRELRGAGVQPDEIPTISFSIAEPELASMPIGDMVGDYAAWNYFMSVDTPENEAFVKAYRARYGADEVVSDPMEAAYFGVHLWALAAREAGSVSPAAVRDTIREIGHEAPSGRIYVDRETRHTWKTVRIGRIRPDAQFETVWTSGQPVRPVPYPRTRSREEWDALVGELRAGWGGEWAAPAATEPRP